MAEMHRVTSFKELHQFSCCEVPKRRNLVLHGFTTSSFSAIQDKTGLTQHGSIAGGVGSIVIDTDTRRQRVVYNEKSRVKKPERRHC